MQRKSYVLVLIALALGCSSYEPQPVESNAVFRAAASGVPSCMPGHEAALAHGTVTIRPGETLCVTVRSEGLALAPVAVVGDADPGEKIVLRSWQEPGSDDVFLTVHNPFPQHLKYGIAILRPGERRFQRTGSCPALSNRFALEQWPYPVAAIALAEFRLLSGTGDAISCE
ncbi:MAG: hypothetical protein AB7P78_17595 [Candidatus Binatia bacterium]